VSASFKIAGLPELLEELRRLPADLVDEATPIVLDAGNHALDGMHYPERTGELAEKLTIAVTDGGPFGVAVTIKNTSKLAWIFENGSQARHTSIGADRGTMPAGHVFIPQMIQWRRWMFEQLRALLVAHGLTVSGNGA
jgi:hypothetical protein